MQGVEQIIRGVIKVEGGYVDHPSDPGGATKFGITEKVARANGYTGHMRDLPEDLAFRIYYNQYVLLPNFDDVAAIDEKIAEELIDSGVNAGVSRASEWLQQALNGLNERGKAYPDIVVDGKIGAGSIAALRAFKKRRGADATTILLRALDAFQGAHYLKLASNNSKFEDFLNGWLRTRIGNVALA